MTPEERSAYNKAYKKKNKEKLCAYNNEHYKANKEKYDNYRKAYHEANKEKEDHNRKVYVDNNKSKIKAYMKSYHKDYNNNDKNKDKNKDSNRAFRANNPGKANCYARNHCYNLTDGYLKNKIVRSLDVERSEITPIDIEEKREQIIYKRQIKSLTKKLKENETVES